MEATTKNLLRFLILPLVVLAVVLFVADRQVRPDFLLHVDFFDVGQGDSMFIQTYLGNQIVIDGGPSDQVLSELGKVMPFFDRWIDMLVLTHPHADHVTGLTDILKRYAVKKVLLPEEKFSSAVYQEFLDLIEKKHIEKIYAQTGERVWLDPATVFDVYSPPAGQIDETKGSDAFGNNSMDVNDTSIVGKLSFGKTRFLFMGDAGFAVEQELIPEFNLQADVLKVGHHGSRYSSSAEFLQAVSPKYAVIEVGAKNTYGHPTQQTLDALAAVHAQIFRTDVDHTVEFTSDGTNLAKK